MRKILIIGLLFVSWVVSPEPAFADEPQGVVIFGDSLSDTGLSFSATGIPPAPAYFEGRFSNGPIWIDFLQEELGLADENVLNLAVGGSSTGFGFKAPPSGIFETPPGFVIPTIGAQIDVYLESSSPQADQLFIIWGGSNDLLNSDSPFTVAKNVEQHVRSLAEAGADAFLVPNVPPLGKTPLVNASFQGRLLNLYVLIYNWTLNRRLDQLEDELEITIDRLDTFSLVYSGLIFPSSFGLTNTTDAALSDIESGLITPEQGATYFFWDVIHPTSLVHRAIADKAIAVLNDD